MLELRLECILCALDVQTHWSSTYKMVSLLTTTLLQKDEFTLTDFFGCVQVINMKMKQYIDNPEARKYTKLSKNA